MTLNLLPIAMRATAILGCNKTFKYFDYDGTTTNEIGNEVLTYTEPITYTGSIQPVSNKMYEQLGLDLQKNYKVVYCPQLLHSIAEKEVTGKIEYNGGTYDIIENKNWWETNGYTKCIICEIKKFRDDNNLSNQNEESDI